MNTNNDYMAMRREVLEAFVKHAWQTETITVETAFLFSNGIAVEKVEQRDAPAPTRSFYISVV